MCYAHGMPPTDSVEQDLRKLMDVLIEGHPKVAALARAESAKHVPADERPDMDEYIALMVEIVRVGRASILRLAAEVDRLKAGQDDASR
jgi:hypothetical protein